MLWTKEDLRQRGWSVNTLKKYGPKCSVYINGKIFYDPVKATIEEQEVRKAKVEVVKEVQKVKKEVVKEVYDGEEILNFINSYEIELAPVTVSDLRKMLERHNKLNKFVVTVTGYGMVAFMRHNLTNYHAALRDMRIKTGSIAFYPIMKERFVNAIYERLPELKENRIYPKGIK